MNSHTIDGGKKDFLQSNIPTSFALSSFQCFPHRNFTKFAFNNNTDDNLRPSDWTPYSFQIQDQQLYITSEMKTHMPPSPPDSSNESVDHILQEYLNNNHYQPNNQIHKAKEIDKNSTKLVHSAAVHSSLSSSSKKIEANQKRAAKLNSSKTTLSKTLRSSSITGENEKSPDLLKNVTKQKCYSRELKNLECSFQNTNILVGKSRNARIVATIALQESGNKIVTRKRRKSVCDVGNVAKKHDCFPNTDKHSTNVKQAAQMQISLSPKIQEEIITKPIRAGTIRNRRQTYYDKTNRESPPNEQREKRRSISPIIVKRRMSVIGETWSIAKKRTNSISLNTAEETLYEYAASPAETIIFDHDEYNSEDSKTKRSQETKNITKKRDHLKILSQQIQPIVRLKRLSTKVIEQLQVGKEAVNPSCRLSITSETNSKSFRKKETQSKLLNNNPRMVYNSVSYCKLCKSKPKDLTFHYISRHKTESFVTRLTVEKLEQANFAIASPSRKHFKFKQYTVICKFCDEDLEDTFERLHDHYSTHTGEYAFKCALCPKVMPFEEDILSHQQHDRDCRNGGLERIYTYSSNLSIIYLYSCIHCNFVQMNVSNVIKHLNKQHNLSDAARSIKKYKLTERDGAVIKPPVTFIHIANAVNSNPITEIESIFPPVSYHKPVTITARVKTETNETKNAQLL